VVQHARSDGDLRLFGQVDVGWNAVERDIHEPLFVHRVALDLDAGDVPREMLAWLRPQGDLSRLTHAQTPCQPLIDIPHDPDRARLRQCEYPLP
jgi:hypothetical protein